MTNIDVKITHAKKEGKLVFVDDVPNGNECNCTCTKCGEPLQAKNKGFIKQHHFAHIVETNCKGETVFHIEAKKQIYNDGFLILPIVKRDQVVVHNMNNYNPYVVPFNTDFDKSKSRSDTYETIEDIYVPEKVKFEKIEVEKQIGNSKYIADLICTDKEGKELIVEIAYKHFLSKQKKRYLIDNKIETVEININDWINARSNNKKKEPLSKYMSSEFFESISRWIYNAEHAQYEKEKIIKLKEKRRRLEAERKRREKDIEEDLAEQERKWKEDPLNQAITKEQNKLDKAFKEIWSNTKKEEKLIYGNLVAKDLREYGNKYPSTLCVESSLLSKEYNNLAMVHEYHQRIFRPYVGQKVGIKIIYELDLSEISYGFDDIRYFPRCIIFWMDGKTKEELSEIRDLNGGLSFIKDYDFVYNY